MRRPLVVAALVVGAAAPYAPSAAADPIPAPPYVARTAWVHWGDLSSLRVFPTRAGRAASLVPGADTQAAEAWSEVTTLAPDAATPGMREQFMCHWHYAETAMPGKSSWNLEPWRPVVTEDVVVATGCNPGGTEEPIS